MGITLMSLMVNKIGPVAIKSKDEKRNESAHGKYVAWFQSKWMLKWRENFQSFFNINSKTIWSLQSLYISFWWI